MKRKNITFRVACTTNAAGKMNPDLPLLGNEDNFYFDDNLADDKPNHFITDEPVELSDCGMLMVVADGMGGMNAGEVASAIAVNTVEEMFAPNKIIPSMAADSKKRKSYLEKVIIEADKRIKKDSMENPEHANMGSTIILAWLVGDQVTISWCGDSRAYRYNPAFGLEILSEDHSFVQDLVKQGALTYAQTFNHPQGNIVTRSLGETIRTAEPETREFQVYKGDILLLCSDGLSGVVFDYGPKNEQDPVLSPYNIEDVIRNNRSSMRQCCDALLCAAEKCDWYDNVTILLCEIMDGADDFTEKHPSNTDASQRANEAWHNKTLFKVRNRHLAVVLVLILALLLTLCGIYLLRRGEKSEIQQPRKTEIQKDTVLPAAVDQKNNQAAPQNIEQDKKKSEKERSSTSIMKNVSDETPLEKKTEISSEDLTPLPQQNKDTLYE